MPDAPEENDEHDSFQIPPRESDADRSEKNRRENKAPPETFEKRAIAVGANHSRHVVAHRAKGCDEKINVLRAPPRLCQREHWQSNSGVPT